MIGIISEYTPEQLHNMFVEHLKSIKPIETGINFLDRIFENRIPFGNISCLCGESKSYYPEFLDSLAKSGKCIIIDTEKI